MNESIETKIELIEADIANAYTEAEAKGATMPRVQGSANLADTVASIPTGSTPTLITKQITENGTYVAEDETPPADGYSEVTVDVVGFEYVDENATLILIDWEGTLLRSYTYNEVMALTELPNPSDLPNYAYADHEWLVFQEWTNTLQYIKNYLQHRPYGHITVGALYTTSDGQNHSYWNSDRASATNEISVLKVGSTSNIDLFSYGAIQKISIPIGVGSVKLSSAISLKQVNIPPTVTNVVLYNCTMLEYFNIPDGVTSLNCNSVKEKRVVLPNSLQTLSSNCFSSNSLLEMVEIPSTITQIETGCFTSTKSLTDVVIKGKPTAQNSNLFLYGSAALKIYVPRDNLSWFSTATNWADIYSQYQFVAIEDNIEYLESLGFNVDEYKGASS